MTPVRRWLLVALTAVLCIAAPLSFDLIPAQGSDASATALRKQISASARLSWSGAATTRGTLKIPAAQSFAGLSKLLGDNNSLRVWWNSADRWRVDTVRPTGETDLIRSGTYLTSWRFESEKATQTPYSDIRLPNASDLLPPRLAARLLSGSTASELSRLGSERVAGHSAAGLRLTPADKRSTIDHADIWADISTGLPLKVEAYVAGDTRPFVTSRMTSIDYSRPKATITQFVAPHGVEVKQSQSIDVAAAANAFAPFVLPSTVAGLSRSGDAAAFGAVGAYGRGPTALIVIPLRRSLSGQVRQQFQKEKSSVTNDNGTSLQVGPLSVLLTRGGRNRGTFLLAGTVTPQTLIQAAGELRSGVTFR